MHTIKPLTTFEGMVTDKSLMTYLTLMGQKGFIDGYIWYIEGPKEKIIVDTGIGTETFEPPEELHYPLPVITPGIHKDPVQAYESVLRIKEIADVIFPLQEPGLGVAG